MLKYVALMFIALKNVALHSCRGAQNEWKEMIGNYGNKFKNKEKDLLVLLFYTYAFVHNEMAFEEF